jgi:hypothetical protein
MVIWRSRSPAPSIECKSVHDVLYLWELRMRRAGGCRIASCESGPAWLKGVAMPRKTTRLTIAFMAGLALMSGSDLAGGHQPTAYVTVRPLNTGQTYVPSLRLFRTPIAGRVQFTTVYRVAIFPFADYSHQQSFIRPLEWGGNRTVIETMTDRFIAHGIGVALQDDLEAILVADGIMRPPQDPAGGTGVSPSAHFAQRTSISNTPEYELMWGMHDQGMRDEIQGIVQTQDYFRIGGLTFHSSSEPLLQGVTAGLSKEKIIELGRLLDVDLIVRGRILEFGLNPARPDSSVVQLRVYAQDAKSGELFWSNRGEFEVTSRQGFFGSTSADHRALFDGATRELIDALMTDFFGER